jgi:hypothetical protein
MRREGGKKEAVGFTDPELLSAHATLELNGSMYYGL